MPETVLVVEDEPTVRSFIEEYLSGHGYQVFTATDGSAMFRILKQRRIDLIVLDLMLPGKDGFELTKLLRAENDLPIIMVTGRGDLVDRVVGLEIGADDYLAKPFDPRELLARVRALLRRGARSAAAERTEGRQNRTIARFAGWRQDLARRRMTSPQGADVRLTAAEFDLLSAFLSHPNRVLSRDRLVDLAYGRNMFLFERSIDTLVARLRRKIEEDRHNPSLIQTVRGSGYVFTPEVEWS